MQSGRGRLEISVLGPTVITDGERVVDVPRRLERALAVRLSLARGAVVPDEILVRDLWGDEDTARPAERLRVVASRLRAALGPAADALRRLDGGYAIDARPADLVAAEASLAGLAAALRAGDPDGVREAAAAAGRRFRGAALADLRSVPFARAEGDRLDAVRLDLLVEQLEAETALRPAIDLLAELGELAAAHPLHERIARLRARILYRDGRPADALAVLADLRARLADELGVDPAPETGRLEVRILRQDPDLAEPETPAAVPDQRSPRRAVPSLPRSGSTFVGRDGECVTVVELLREPVLVTLTGSPGSGKTRLALEVARRVGEQARTVAWVDLAPLSEPSAVLPALATAAGLPVTDAPTEEVLARCATALSNAVLVVDNAEHLVDPVSALIDRLRRTAPELSVLVTSQRPLLLAGEELHHVDALSPAAAASLFEQRSSGAVGTSAETSSDVASICAAVDHLPLGVELAAGLTRTLTVGQIAARLDDRLRLLVGGSRDAGERHTSLRAAIEWSHRLLDPVSAAVLRRMSVFAGGCSLEAAERVIPDGVVVHAADLPAALTDLVDRCLVSATERNGARRFVLLESVRAYASDRLALEGEEDEVRARHLAWCAEHVAAHDVQGDDPGATLAAVFSEWPDLLAALSTAVGTPRALEALRLAVALDDPWMFRGWHDEARRNYSALVDAPGADDALRAHALSNFGFVSSLVGDTARAEVLLERAAVLAESAGVPEIAMRVQYHRGIAAVERGRPRDARAFLDAARDIAERLGRERAMSAIDDVLATVHLYSGDTTVATELHRAVNARDREAGHEHGLVRGLVNEATAWLSAGNLAECEACVAEASTLADRLEDLMAIASLVALRGQVALARGDLTTAVDELESASGELGWEEIHSRLFRLHLADALMRAGRPADAAAVVDDVLSAASPADMAWLVAQPTLAEIRAAEGDLAAAAGLVDATRRELAERGFGWSLVVHRLDRAVAAVGLASAQAR